MSLKIRLARGGAKKKPFYSIVVANSRSPRDGRFIEKIGTYNPILPGENEKRVVIKLDRAQEWLAKGAQPTDRVARMLDQAGLLQREARNNPNKAEPGKKMQERAKERADKIVAAEEARAKAEEAARQAEIDAKAAREAEIRAAAEAAAAPADAEPAAAEAEAVESAEPAAAIEGGDETKET